MGHFVDRRLQPEKWGETIHFDGYQNACGNNTIATVPKLLHTSSDLGQRKLKDHEVEFGHRKQQSSLQNSAQYIETYAISNFWIDWTFSFDFIPFWNLS